MCVIYYACFFVSYGRGSLSWSGFISVSQTRERSRITIGRCISSHIPMLEISTGAGPLVHSSTDDIAARIG